MAVLIAAVIPLNATYLAAVSISIRISIALLFVAMRVTILVLIYEFVYNVDVRYDHFAVVLIDCIEVGSSRIL